MNIRTLIGFAFATVLSCGCASTTSHTDGFHHDGPFTQELGSSNIGDHNTMLGRCHGVPCSVLAGPGCC